MRHTVWLGRVNYVRIIIIHIESVFYRAALLKSLKLPSVVESIYNNDGNSGNNRRPTRMDKKTNNIKANRWMNDRTNETNEWGFSRESLISKFEIYVYWDSSTQPSHFKSKAKQGDSIPFLLFPHTQQRNQ